MNFIVNAYNRSPVSMVRGEGVFLFDQDGKRYLDFTAGIATVSLGHSHPYIVEKLQEQLHTLWHCSNLFSIPEQQRLAERLTGFTFSDKVFFCSSGLEATEAAIKFIRRYFYTINTNRKKRYRIITLEGGFHGRSIAAISAGGNKKSREGFAPLLSGFDKVPRNDIAALKRVISDETAAVFLEPIQSEGGVYPLDTAYLQEIKELTKSMGIILCFDEVQSGYMRTGELFYYQQIGVEPDILTCAKAMGNGFPLAACLVKDYIADTISPGSHGSTYGGNPLAMVVGNAVLDLMLENDFNTHVYKISKYLKDKLLSLEFPDFIKDVRGIGCLLGIEVSNISASKIVEKCLQKGLLLTKVLDDKVIRITPSLIIHEEHIDTALDILHDSFLNAQKELKLLN